MWDLHDNACAISSSEWLVMGKRDLEGRFEKSHSSHFMSLHWSAGDPHSSSPSRVMRIGPATSSAESKTSLKSLAMLEATSISVHALQMRDARERLVAASPHAIVRKTGLGLLLPRSKRRYAPREDDRKTLWRWL